MKKIPTPEQNSEGLHSRYRVTKANGDPVDPEAVYFVLRLDRSGSDPAHAQACREAARAYALFVIQRVPSLSKVGEELAKLVDEIEAQTTVDS